MGCVYCATNKINGKMYIGITSKKFEVRKKKHIIATLNMKDTCAFHKALRLHGIDNFSWKILEECNDREKLSMLEQIYIDMFDTYNLGYNMTLGGESTLGYYPSSATRKKMSKSAKNRPPMSEATKNKIIKNLKYGQSKESRRKASQTMLGHVVTVDTRSKISKSHIGKTLSEETRNKMSKSRKINPNRHTVVLQYTKNGEFLSEWYSLAEASRNTKISRTNIGNVCAGLSKTAGGFIWKYKDKPKVTYYNYCVAQFTVDGVFLHEYASSKEVLDKYHMTLSCLTRACRNKDVVAYGYKWMYVTKDKQGDI